MGSRARRLGVAGLVCVAALIVWFGRGERAKDADGLAPPVARAESDVRPAQPVDAPPGEAGRTGVTVQEDFASDVDAAEPVPEPAIVLRVVIESASSRAPREILDASFGPYGYSVNVIATPEPPPALLAHDPLESWGVGGAFRELDPREYEQPPVRGTLVLAVPPPLYVSLVIGQAVVVTEFAPSGTEEVILTLPDDLAPYRGSFEVRYTREDPARPLAGSVFIETSASSSSTALSKYGRLRQERVQPGRVRLQLLATDAQPWEKTFEVAPGEHVDLGDVVLREGAVITGYARLDGARIAGIGLELTPEPSADVWKTADGRWDTIDWEPAGNTSDDGSFRIGWKPPGRYLLRTVPRGLPSATGDEQLVTAPCQLVDTRGGARNGIALLLEEAAEVALPRAVEGTRAKRFQVLDARRNVVHRGRVYGHDAFVHLVKGSYTVVFRDEENEIARRDVRVKRRMGYLGDAP